MYNILNKLEYYKGKSAMIIETSIGVQYGTATPFVKFKFAPRDSYKAPGKWDDNNVYWITSFVDLAVFTKNIKLVAEGKLEKYEMKNPSKKVTLLIVKTKNDNDGVEYMNFNFYKESVKINTSLIKTTEFYALFMFFNNLVNSYCIVAQTALMKYDIWYEFVGKTKNSYQNKNNSYNNKPNQQQQNNNYQSQNNNTHSNKPNQQYQSSNKNTMNKVEEDINAMSSDFDFGNDVPF